MGFYQPIPTSQLHSVIRYSHITPPPQPNAVGVASMSSINFKVHRQEPELVSPAKPTPREVKLLSDIDDQDAFRFQSPIIHTYRHNPSKMNVDPVCVIRQALAKTLVYFYPLAGRLREGSNRKLMVDCTGEGVIFIEADADVALDDFGELHPPIPCFEELLSEVPGWDGVTNSPLMLFQVTRLKCGGFILAYRFNHTMCDAAGIVLFMNTLAEMACGANAPTVWPSWARHLLNARVPRSVTHTHHEYNEMVAGGADTLLTGRMIHRSFFFGPKELSAIRKLMPPDLSRRSTTVDTLTSFLWRYRTIALRPEPDTEMRMIVMFNVRNKFSNLPLPPGYYGNALVIPATVATAKDIIEKPLEFVLKLRQKTKYSMTEEYVKSVADLLVTRGRPNFTTAGTYIVSDLTRARMQDVDFGWGKAVYAGPAKAGAGPFPGVSYLVPFKNKSGEDGVVVPIFLPEPAMERFAEELDRVFGRKKVAYQGSNEDKIISSSL